MERFFGQQTLDLLVIRAGYVSLLWSLGIRPLWIKELLCQAGLSGSLCKRAACVGVYSMSMRLTMLQLGRVFGRRLRMTSHVPMLGVWGGDFNMLESPDDRRGGSGATIHGAELTASWEWLCLQLRV